MNREATTRWLIQFGLALVLAMGSGLASLIIVGALGGTAIGLAPAKTFGLVERFLCREGEQLQYYSVQRNFHEPGESEPHLECRDPSGRSRDVLLEGIFNVLGLGYLLASGLLFLITFIPLSILTSRVVRHFQERDRNAGRLNLS